MLARFLICKVEIRAQPVELLRELHYDGRGVFSLDVCVQALTPHVVTSGGRALRGESGWFVCLFVYF